MTEQLQNKYPAFFVVFCIASGIITGACFSFSLLYFILLPAIILLLVSGFKVKTGKSVFFIYGAAILAGFFSAAGMYDQPYRDMLEPLHRSQTPVHLTGVIRKVEELTNNRIRLTLDVTSFNVHQKCTAVPLKLIAYLNDRPRNNLQYGDMIKMAGIIRLPAGERFPGGFDYRRYLARQGINAVFYQDRKDTESIISHGNGNPVKSCLIIRPKLFFSRLFERYFPAGEAEIMKGLLLGIRRGIDPDFSDSLAKLGVVHILAISGLHVGFIFFLIQLLFRKLPVKPFFRSMTVVLILLFYMLLTGANPPVIRATLFIILLEFGHHLERRVNLLNILSVTAIAILIGNPAELFSPGFQLSFAAVAGIHCIGTKLSAGANIDRIRKVLSRIGIYKQNARIARFMKKWILAPFLLSIGAFLFTTPVAGYYFGRIAVWAPLMNIIYIPAVSLLVPLGALIMLAGSVFPLITAFLAGPALLLLKFMEYVTGFAIKLPLTGLGFSRNGCIYFAAAVIIITILFNIKQKKRYLLFAGLAYANFLIWQPILFQKSNEMTCVFFDVGQGDAALVRFYDRCNILIDTGYADGEFNQFKRNILPYFRQNGITSLDAVVISHAHRDHIGGLPAVLEEIPVRRVFINPLKEDNEFSAIINMVHEYKIPVRQLYKGDIVSRFPGVRFYSLSPMADEYTDNENEDSIILKLQTGSASALFTGDADRKTLKEVGRYGNFLKSGLFKFPHHGSKYSLEANFIVYVQPDITIFSAGEFNRFGHPAKEVIRFFSENKMQFYFTGRDGTVTAKWKESRFISAGSGKYRYFQPILFRLLRKSSRSLSYGVDVFTGT